MQHLFFIFNPPGCVGGLFLSAPPQLLVICVNLGFGSFSVKGFMPLLWHVMGQQELLKIEAKRCFSPIDSGNITINFHCLPDVLRKMCNFDDFTNYSSPYSVCIGAF